MVLCPNGAQGDSPGQSEAPPWDWCARNNPSPERAEPAARKPMCYVSPFQGLGELGRRRAQVAGVPRVALRSTLGYLIMPRWGERSRGKNSGTVPGVFQHSVPPLDNCIYRQIGPVAFTPQGNYPSDIPGYSASAGTAPALASFSSCQSW